MMKTQTKFQWSLGATLLGAFSLSLLNLSHAHEEDRGEDQPDYAQRLARVRLMKPHRMSEGLRQRAVAKIRRAALEASGEDDSLETARAIFGGPAAAFPFTAQPELRSTGTVNTLTVLIDFKDHRAGTNLPTREDFQENIYGDGTQEAQNFVPFESVHSYYRRASEGLSNLQGTVLDWYHFPNDRSEYEPDIAPPGPNLEGRQLFLDNRALFAMAREVLEANATHDFTQYDNDNDGDIDLLTILYAGPRGAWSSFWWAYRWEFAVPEALTTKFGGKRLKQFVFQFIDTRGPSNDFNPSTLLHEMGHAYGLADYYDYDAEIGPPGGVGGLDMMHANMGNHCAFSRWLLDWIRPTVIGSGQPATHTLVAAGKPFDPNRLPEAPSNKAIAVFPGLTSTVAPDTEMFIIENRHQIGNDAGRSMMPGDGILCWHVEGSPNSQDDDFAFDNSFTDHKLIRLVRADNEEDFDDREFGSSLTYFRTGSEFSNSSVPASLRIDGTPSHVAFRNVSGTGESVTLEVGIDDPVPTPAHALLAGGSSPTEESSALPARVDEPSLEAVAAEATDQAIDLEVIDSLDQALASADSLEISQVWAKMVEAGSTSEQAKLSQRMILTRWASKDGQSAMHALLSLKDPTLHEQNFQSVMLAWATNDPLGAAEWYLSAPQESLRKNPKLKLGSRAAEKIFCCLALQSPEEATPKLDLLNDVETVYGALKGLNMAQQMVTPDTSALSAAFQELKNNKALVLETEKLLKLREQIAPEQIKNLEQRAQFESFLDGITH